MKTIALFCVCVSIVLSFNKLNAQPVTLDWCHAQTVIASVRFYTTIDADGNVYKTGMFQGTVDFDPSSNVVNLVGSTVFADGYIQKLDAQLNVLP